MRSARLGWSSPLGRFLDIRVSLCVQAHMLAALPVPAAQPGLERRLNITVSDMWSSQCQHRENAP